MHSIVFVCLCLQTKISETLQVNFTTQEFLELRMWSFQGLQDIIFYINTNMQGGFQICISVSLCYG